MNETDEFSEKLQHLMGEIENLNEALFGLFGNAKNNDFRYDMLEIQLFYEIKFVSKCLKIRPNDFDIIEEYIKRRYKKLLEDKKIDQTTVEDLFAQHLQNRFVLKKLIDENMLPLQKVLKHLRKDNDILYFYPIARKKLLPKVFAKWKNSYSRRTIQLLIRYFPKNDSQMESVFMMNQNNPDTLAKIMRNDDVDQFIYFISQQNTPLDMKIPYSFFDASLMNKIDRPHLIEYASFYGATNIIKYLLLNKTKITEKAFIYAWLSRKLDIVHLLETPKIDYYLCCKYLIKYFVNTEIIDYLIENKTINPSEFALLKQSILHFHVSYFKRYFPENNTDILTETDVNQNSLLHYASMCGNTAVVEFLCNKLEENNILTENINQKNYQGRNSLHLSIRNDHFLVFKILVKYKAKIDEKDDISFQFTKNSYFFLIIFFLF